MPRSPSKQASNKVYTERKLGREWEIISASKVNGEVNGLAEVASSPSGTLEY